MENLTINVDCEDTTPPVIIPNWNANTEYKTGDLVRKGNDTYKALVDNVQKNPEKYPEIWEKITSDIVTLPSKVSKTSKIKKLVKGK